MSLNRMAKLADMPRAAAGTVNKRVLSPNEGFSFVDRGYWHRLDLALHTTINSDYY